MTELDTLVDWASTLIVASLTWVAGIGGASSSAPANAELPLMLGWAQTTDASDIQQVGEETGVEDDVEELDAGAPPVETVETVAASEEAVPAGAVDDEDIELLDQGTPPAATVSTTYTEPAPIPAAGTTSDSGVVYTAPAPAQPSGPVLPEGFGEGQVHVSAGHREFPPGLEGCEVGAVTGRAYVGIDCDADGSDVVGHAPTFEDFPFVLEDTFPFDPDSPLLTEDNFPFDDNVGFFTAGSDDDGGSDTVLVSAGRGTGNAAIGTTGDEGGSSINLAQRARDRGPRVDTADDSGRDRAASKKRNRGNVSTSSADDSSGKETASDSTKAKKAKAKKDKSRAQKAKKDRGDERDRKAKNGKKSKEKHSGKKKKSNNKRSGKKR